MYGSHLLKAWSKTQATIALSSGESETLAAIRAGTEALSMMALMKDLGMDITAALRLDASAALGIIHRKGLGRTRHIDTGLLWMQQTAAERRLEYSKVLGTDNPADLLTKHLNAEVLDRHCLKINLSFPQGRAATAPTLNVFVTKAVWEIGGEEESEEEKEEGELGQLDDLKGLLTGKLNVPSMKALMKNPMDSMRDSLAGAIDGAAKDAGIEIPDDVDLDALPKDMGELYEVTKTEP